MRVKIESDNLGEKTRILHVGSGADLSDILKGATVRLHVGELNSANLEVCMVGLSADAVVAPAQSPEEIAFILEELAKKIRGGQLGVSVFQTEQQIKERTTFGQGWKHFLIDEAALYLQWQPIHAKEEEDA